MNPERKILSHVLSFLSFLSSFLSFFEEEEA